MRRAATPACIALFVALTGCGDDDPPLEVDLLWLINAVDASDANCREQGIEEIRLRLRPAGADEGPVRSVSFECAQGQARTRASADPTGLSLDVALAYDYLVEALDGEGRVLHSVEDGFRAPAGTLLVELPIVDIFQPFGDAASLSAEWRFEGTSTGDLARACDVASVATVALDVASATDADFLDSYELFSVPCEQGQVVDDTAVLATGEYWVRYVGLNARGAVEQTGEPLEVSVVERNLDIPLETHTFE